MYTLIVADDEQIIREGIASMEWNNLNISVVSIVSNGLDCMDKIRRLNPDIVLADIRMPGMTGIEIAKQAKIEKYLTKFIFITGFREFEYAKQSIDLGIVSFVLKPTTPAEIQNAVKEARDRIEQERERVKEKESLYKQLLENHIALSDKWQSEGKPQNRLRTAKLIEFLESNFRSKVTLESAGRALSVSPEYLSRLIKKETGSTFLELLTRIRLKKACKLLSGTDLTVVTISEEIGYDSSGYFSQIFKKYYGLSPSDFRRRIIDTTLKMEQEKKRDEGYIRI